MILTGVFDDTGGVLDDTGGVFDTGRVFDDTRQGICSY